MNIKKFAGLLIIFVGLFFCYFAKAAVVAGLGVTQITAVKSYAIADGTFENGWQWVFDVTVPANETMFNMKFADWVNGLNSISTANNVRFYSAQSINAPDAARAITITSANAYGAVMNIIPDANSDLDFTKAGRQIRVIVETRVPVGSAGGSYTTSYGINSAIDSNVIVPAQGQEGYISVSINPVPADSTEVYEGDSRVGIYGLKIKATSSDMDVQRVTLEFNKQPYAFFSTVYLYDGPSVIASAALNSTTVTKVDVTHYQVTLSNFSSKVLIANNSAKVLTVKVDVNIGILSGYFPAGSSHATITVSNPNITSVRAVDEAGFDRYGGVTAARTIIIASSDSGPQSDENATLTVSLDANSPKARNVIADSSQKIAGATLLTFDMKATGDDLLLDTIADVTFAAGGVYADPVTVYLYDGGGSAIGTGTPSASHKVTFTDLNYTIHNNTTKTFTIRIDDTLAAASAITGIGADDSQQYKVIITGANVGYTKTNGMVGFGTGLATSYDMIAYAAGPIFTLVSISTSSTQPSYSGASSTISATFNIQVQAVTGDVYIPAADTSNAFTVDYGYNSADQSATGVSVTYVQPSGTTLTSFTSTTARNAYKVGQGTSATFAVGATVTRSSGSTGYYDLRMQAIKWVHTWDITNNDVARTYHLISSTYMAGDSNWISQQVNLQ